MDALFQWFSILPAAAQATIVSALVSAIVALFVAFSSPFVSRRLERLKAELAQDASLNDARRSYEFEAKKRLYSEVEPLFFSLFEAAEGSYYRVASLARTQRQGHLDEHDGSWLAQEGYYLKSTVYKIFLPLVIFRLIQKTATFVDIELDHSVRTRYFLLKLGYYSITDDFVFARIDPELPYSPNVPDWRDRIEGFPEEFKRQGLVIGHLDRLLDAMIVTEDGGHRPMNFGEFESSYRDDENFKAAVSEAAKLFVSFSFPKRPILARFLLAHAYTMRLLLLTYVRDVGHDDLVKALHKFCNSDKAFADLSWNTSEDKGLPRSVSMYVEERLDWMSAYDNDIR